jgi:hypothetical protein
MDLVGKRHNFNHLSYKISTQTVIVSKIYGQLGDIITKNGKKNYIKVGYEFYIIYKITQKSFQLSFLPNLERKVGKTSKVPTIIMGATINEIHHRQTR